MASFFNTEGAGLNLIRSSQSSRKPRIKTEKSASEIEKEVRKAHTTRSKRKPAAKHAPVEEPFTAKSSILSRPNYPSGSAPKVKNDAGTAMIDTNSCNILYIDEQIRKLLISKISTLDELRKDLSGMLWIINNSSDKVDKIQAERESAMLRRRIQDVEGGFDLAFYILRTSDLLDEYRSLVAETENKGFFVKQDPASEGTNAKNFRKNQIISEFLRIARQYIPLENFQVRKKKGAFCDNCHTSSNLRESDDSSIFICSCGNQIEILDDAPTFKDAERVNMSTRYRYTCRGHFIEAMNRFEGKQNTEIGDHVLQIIREQMELHHLTTGPDTDAILGNPGDSNNLSPSSRIPIGTEISSVGVPGKGKLATIFVIPQIGGSATVKVRDANWLAIGQRVYIEGAGYFTVNSTTNFTKEHLYMFLCENRLSDFYADINLLYFLLTQINPPDITKYRTELLEMFEQLEEAYQEIKDDDRLNSLNVNWKLYKLLQLLDYPCKKDDFFCLKTPNKQGEHEEKWHSMINYLKSRYPTLNTSFGKRRWRHVRTI